MSELKKYLHSLIRNADECDAGKASLQFDLGQWIAIVTVQKKSCTHEEGGER